ncbi:NTF2 fold immunity protein [Luteimonas sp. A482]
MKATFYFLAPLLLVSGCAPSQENEHNVLNLRDLVQDEATAITIAVAVWEPIYGKEEIASQAPYSAELIDGQWTVSGYLPPSHAGGTAIAVISKRDGQILRVSHGR